MSKELEALKVRVWNKIKDISNCKFPLDSFFNDIENYEKEEDKMSLLTDIETIADTFMSIIERKEKLEKVLEIVKKKKVDFDLLYEALENYWLAEEQLDYYNSCKSFIHDNCSKLTETEFNLLKEIM